MAKDPKAATMQQLSGIRACIFDAYGTLFDFATAATAYRDVLGDKMAPLSALWRDKQLQYTWLRALQGRHADFWQVTGDALDYAFDALEIGNPDLRAKLMEMYLKLGIFPEVPSVLRRLKSAGMKTAILSNGTPQMLKAAVDHAGIADLFDAVLSVEEVGVFKTHPKVYQLAIDRLETEATAVSFQSSNAWDAHAASAFGMHVIWCNRYGQRRERLPGEPDREVPTLELLPEILGL